MSFDSTPRLAGWQRSRLVRSTRKLAKLLGETPVSVPQITLPPPGPLSPRTISECPRSPIASLKKLARTAFEPIQVALRRDPDSDGEGARSTNSELACVGTSSLRGHDQSPVLFFGAPNLAPVDSHARRIPQVPSNSPSPCGPSFRRRRSSLGSIASSELVLSATEWEECEAGREARRRRKRLSKLTRHLGESIPPYLISPNMTYSKPKSNINTPIVTTNMHSTPPLEQRTPFFSTTLPSPISKSPKPAVARTVDSFVGSIGRSLSHRSNADATSSRLLAWRHRRSRSESTPSLSHEHLTPPNTYFAPDDHPDTPVFETLGYRNGSPLRSGPPLRPLPGTPPDHDVISHRSELR
ncbi:hypothetical protein EDB92DRAFT_1942375 [Lactarius akahatsu]|uniref:Uncharacterized protein n=1 Tax=Lactarius akahatsu TaxID=416441 RepID=A0AAD4QAN8_9AGAM|nr:hypothetical protein EDB92DRAFT_1942375 [Lactarius akahatsu]